MGIDIARFIGHLHETFTCQICLDVVEDPIMTPCDHMFCKDCFRPGKCPSCRQEANDAKPINRVLRQVYHSLEMKCLSQDCSEIITVETYKSHDESCPKRFFQCFHCGFKAASPGGQPVLDHKCIQYLSGQIASMKKELSSKKEVQSSIAALIKELDSIKHVQSLLWTELDSMKSATVRKLDSRKVKCGFMIPIGAKYYKCKTCLIKPSGVLCETCFVSGHHQGHSYEYKKSHGEAFCDCGSEVYLKAGSVYCRIHQ